MENQNGVEFEMLELLRYLKRKIWNVLLSLTVCTILGFLISGYCMTPQYTATTQVYVLNRSSETAVVFADFSLSNYMINDYQVLVTGRNVTNEVIEKLKLNMTLEELADKIDVGAENNTRVLQISVTDSNPQRAADIANCVREVACAQINEIMDVDTISLLYAASVPEKASSPNVTKNTIVAGILGMLLSVAVYSVIFVLDDTIQTEEDVERYLGLGTMGAIPFSSELANTRRSVSPEVPDGMSIVLKRNK